MERLSDGPTVLMTLFHFIAQNSSNANELILLKKKAFLYMFIIFWPFFLNFF